MLTIRVGRGLAVRRKVVVAIRGTLSIQDCMTDCIADDESLDALGLAGEFAHDGMYKSARNIKGDLDGHNLLSLLLNDGKVPTGENDSAHLIVVLVLTWANGAKTFICPDHAACVDPASQDCRGFDLVVRAHHLWFDLHGSRIGSSVRRCILHAGMWTFARSWDGSPPHDDAPTGISEHSLLRVLAARGAPERERRNINGVQSIPSDSVHPHYTHPPTATSRVRFALTTCTSHTTAGIHHICDTWRGLHWTTEYAIDGALER